MKPAGLLVAAVLLVVASDAARGVPDEPSAFAARRKGTGDVASDEALKGALDWLARHQAADGTWSFDGFAGRCVGARCGGKGIGFAGGAAPTALALLAFVGAGETPSTGDHKDAVAAALKSVLAAQDADGCFGPRVLRGFLVAHCLATSAVAETCWATRDPALQAPLTKARDFLLRAQNQASGWRYDAAPAGRDDTFMTVTASIALHDVALAGLDVPRSSRDGALAWLDRVTDDAGRAGYQAPGGPDARIASPVFDETAKHELRGFETAVPPPRADGAAASPCSATTAGAALARALAGVDAPAAAKAVAAAPPSGRGFYDLHCALFGSLLFAQRGDHAEWRAATLDTLRKLRRDSGCAAGSHDPEPDPWGLVGGRVYSTAMAALVLEAPTRFPKAKKATTRK